MFFLPFYTRSLNYQSSLEGEPHVLGVAQFVQIGNASILDHRRRSTHEDQNIILRWGQVVSDHLLVHKSLAVVPICKKKMKVGEGEQRKKEEKIDTSHFRMKCGGLGFFHNILECSICTFHSH